MLEEAKEQNQNSYHTPPLDNGPTMSSSNCIMIEGWLEKRSRYLKRWRKRWIVIQHNTLYSYKNKQEYTKPTETIDLKQLTEVKVDEKNSSENKLDLSKSTKYCFNIIISNDKKNQTIFSLGANTNQDRINWMNQIARVLIINSTIFIIPNKKDNDNIETSKTKLLFKKKAKKDKNEIARENFESKSNESIGNSDDINDINNNNNNNIVVKNSIDNDNNIPNYGCQHYRRNCYIKSQCCNHWYFCSYCHDEREDTLKLNSNNNNINIHINNNNSNNYCNQVDSHTLDRSRIDAMTCVACGKEQKPSNQCINPKCHIKMAYYYCDKCKFWNNDSNIELFHCDGCGVCRTGLREDYQHCHKCGVCLSKGYYANHRCIEQATRCDCPICNDFLHMSDKPVTFWPGCGHAIHVECMHEYLKFDSLCSICRTPWVPDVTNIG